MKEKLIIKKYENELFKLLIHDEIFITKENYNFIEYFINDIFIINYEEINDTIKNDLKTNFINYKFLKNKNYKNIDENIKKYLKKEINNIRIKTRYLKKLKTHQFNNLLYLFIMEIIKEYNETNNYKLTQTQIKKIDENIKKLTMNF